MNAEKIDTRPERALIDAIENALDKAEKVKEHAGSRHNSLVITHLEDARYRANSDLGDKSLRPDAS